MFTVSNNSKGYMTILSLDYATGEMLQEMQTTFLANSRPQPDNGPWISRIMVDSSNVYIMARLNTSYSILNAFEKLSGNRLWSVSGQTPNIATPEIPSFNVSPASGVVGVCFGSQFEGFSAKTGQNLFSNSQVGACFGGVKVFESSFLVSDGTNLYSVSKLGKIDWKWTQDSNLNTVQDFGISVNQVGVIATHLDEFRRQTNQLISLDVFSGKVAWNSSLLLGSFEVSASGQIGGFLVSGVNEQNNFFLSHFSPSSGNQTWFLVHGNVNCVSEQYAVFLSPTSLFPTLVLADLNSGEIVLQSKLSAALMSDQFQCSAYGSDLFITLGHTSESRQKGTQLQMSLSFSQ